MSSRSSAVERLCLFAILAAAALGAGCMSKYAPGMGSFDEFQSEAASALSRGGAEQTGEENASGWGADARVVVQGHVSVSVADPDETAGRVRLLARSMDGHVVRETLALGRFMSTVVVRLPPDRVDELLEKVAELGPMVDRNIQRSDVSWQIRDTELQLENLRRTMLRYEELLHVATDVPQILAIEAELGRVRTEIDRIESQRAFLADQVSLATIEVRLMRDFAAEEIQEPRAWPGLRVSHLSVHSRDLGTRRFAGLGFAMHGSRAFHLDVDLLTNLEELAVIDAGLVSVGGEMYSMLLGDGNRSWLNPHMGWALGYAWVEGSSNFLGLITLGVEFFRSEKVLVDSSLRWGMVAGGDGPALVLQPLLSVHIAF